jgi:chorismate mutase
VRPRHRYAGILVLFATLIGGMKAANAATDPMRSLVQSSAQRLQLARKVALVKWYSGAPVEDPSREAEVLQKAAKDGKSMGLESTQVEEFFKAQIEANKLIQYSLLADWRRAGRAPRRAAPDLVKEIRPQLDEIETQLIQELKQSVVARSATTCPVDVAKAVGEYLDSRSVKVDSLVGVALDRAMATACIR